MKLKQLTAGLLATCMLTASIVGTAFAAPYDGGSDLIISNTPANTHMSITGKTFDVYEVFSATINDDHTATDPDSGAQTFDDLLHYTVTAEFAPFFAGKIPTFSYPAAGDYTADQQDDYNRALSAATDAAKKYVNDNKDNMQVLAAELRTFVLTNEIKVAATTKPASDPVATGDSQTSETVDAGLMGYYFVIDSADQGAAGAAAIPAMLCNMPARAGNGQLTADRTINIKASAPTIEKEIWHNDKDKWETVGDYQIGDEVKFLVTATLPTNLTGYTSATYTYLIEDTMSDGLTFKEGSVKLFLDKELTQEVTGNANHEFLPGNDSRIFGIQFDMVAIRALHTDLTECYITYEAIVDDTAKLSTEGCELNTVKLTYSTNPYDKTATSEVEDTVYSFTFDLDVLKTTGDGQTPLAGAEFKLYKENALGEGKDQALRFETKTENGKTIYVVSHSDAASETMVSPANGEFNIVGLDDAITYKLVETKAPEGFNVADDLSFTIVVEYDEDDQGVPFVKYLTAGNVVDNTNNNLSTTIINTSKALLPSTGGVGTTMFTVGGISLMVAAAALLIIKRKKS